MWLGIHFRAMCPLLHNLLRRRVGLNYSFFAFMVLRSNSSLEKMDFRLVRASFDLLLPIAGRTIRRVICLGFFSRLSSPALRWLVFVPALGRYTHAGSFLVRARH